MAETKTKPTTVSVDAFIDKVADEGVRDDCRALIKLMQKVTGSPPVMWGPTIIGFGKYHYKYGSGHEGDSALTGFSPRKPNFVVYATAQEPLMKKLGKHKATKGCIYFKRIADIDLKVLEKLVADSVRDTQKKYPG
jgi:hypothetical protein